MRRFWHCTGLLAGSLLALAPSLARADAHGVGLGLGVGIDAPDGKLLVDNRLESLAPNLDWGFYVDIPLVYGFTLTPHAELYNVNNQVTATDIGMAFKFIIETPIIRPYFGVDVGDTNMVSSQQLNVGGLLGLGFKIVANLDAFVEGRYSEVLRGEEVGGNIGNTHVFAGLLFRF